MAKYNRRTKSVDVEFLKSGVYAENEVERDDAGKPFVIRDSKHEYVTVLAGLQRDGSGRYYVDGARGLQHLAFGDAIVTEPSGKRYVVKPDELSAKYDAVK